MHKNVNKRSFGKNAERPLLQSYKDTESVKGLSRHKLSDLSDSYSTIPLTDAKGIKKNPKNLHINIDK